MKLKFDLNFVNKVPKMLDFFLRVLEEGRLLFGEMMLGTKQMENESTGREHN